MAKKGCANKVRKVQREKKDTRATYMCEMILNKWSTLMLFLSSRKDNSRQPDSIEMWKLLLPSVHHSISGFVTNNSYSKDILNKMICKCECGVV